MIAPRVLLGSRVRQFCNLNRLNLGQRVLVTGSLDVGIGSPLHGNSIYLLELRCSSFRVAALLEKLLPLAFLAEHLERPVTLVEGLVGAQVALLVERASIHVAFRRRVALSRIQVLRSVLRLLMEVGP